MQGPTQKQNDIGVLKMPVVPRDKSSKQATKCSNMSKDLKESASIEKPASGKPCSLLLNDEVTEIMVHHRLRKGDKDVVETIQLATNEVVTRLILDVCGHKKRHLAVKGKLTISKEDVCAAMAGLAGDAANVGEVNKFYAFISTLESLDMLGTETSSNVKVGQKKSRKALAQTKGGHAASSRTSGDLCLDVKQEDNSSSRRSLKRHAVHQAFLRPEKRIHRSFLQDECFGVTQSLSREFRLRSRQQQPRSLFLC